MANKNNLACSLAELEKRFAIETDSWLRQKLETGNLTPDTATAFVKARERCARKLKRQHKAGLIPSITECLKDTKNESRIKAMSVLNKHLGTLIERFGASSGSLFLVKTKFNSVNGEKVLEELLAHNVPSDWQGPVYPLSVDKLPCGLVVLAAYNGQGYIADDVMNGELKRFYKKAIPTTVSEIAIPIFSLENDCVEGVINLESDEPNAFLPFCKGELQAASYTLLPDLLIIKHLDNVETSVGWHPQIHGWNSTDLLQRICDRVSSSQSINSTDQRLICTIWYADWTKASLYVHATARFNFEYIASKLMPLQFEVDGPFNQGDRPNPDVPTRSWMNGEQSMTGLIASFDHGQVKQGRVADVPQFNRQERATKMGIEYIISTPIYSPEIPSNNHSNLVIYYTNIGPESVATSSAEKSVIFEQSTQETNKATKNSIGVLSLYFFRRQQPKYTINIAAGFPEPDVVWLGDVIGGVFTEIQNLRKQVAIANLLAQINERGIPHLNLFDISRDLIKEYFSADGCTVLVTKNARFDMADECIDSSMTILSTTGLISDRKKLQNVDELPIVCRYLSVADPDFVRIQGVTAFLSLLGDGLIRKIDVQDPWETGSWQQVVTEKAKWAPQGNSIDPKSLLILPDGSAREKTAPTESDHRRLLAASTRVIDEQHAGVVRIVRSSGTPPFTEQDGFLLSDLNDKLKEYYRDELKYISASGTDSFAAKLSAKNLNSHMWNRHYVEAILQYLLKALSEESTLTKQLRDRCYFDMAYLRVRTHGAQWQKSLRLYSYFSRESAQIVTEKKEC